jgi:poly(A) polymerase
MITDTLKRFVGKLFGQRSTGLQRIGRDKHGIDRRNVSRHAIKVCEVLQHEGYQA